MDPLTEQRCFNHRQREAVARCPECSRFFCRECITEHDDRVICATCLAHLTATVQRRSRLRERLLAAAQAATAFLALWLMFYSFGRALLRVPTAFHEGTMWSDISKDLHSR